IYETSKQICETQTDVHVVSIDPGFHTPFTWYSPTKGDKLASSNLKRKKKKAIRVDRTVFV
ncbi:19777_t:CDS:2, partial [Gigaspora rosea]